MKIAFVLPGRGRSGGVRSTSIVAKELSARGHQVRVLWRQPPRTLSSMYRSVRDKIVPGGTPDWLNQFPGTLESFKDIRECSFEPSQIIVGVGMAMSSELALLDRLPNPKIQYLHGATPWDQELMARTLRLPFPKILVATYLREIVAMHGSAEVLGIVHNGVDQREYFSSAPETERNGIGMIYSSDPPKGPDTTLAVIKKMSILRPHIPIRLFGAERKPWAMRRVSYWKSPSVEQAREIYSRSLVWVVASRAEGFSLPILEAMACGCAVVATDCGGPSDIIRDRENGLLVPVGDVDGIVERVRELLDNSALRDRVRKMSHETAQRYTWEKCINDLEAAILKGAGILRQQREALIDRG